MKKEVQYRTNYVEIILWPEIPCYEWRALGPMTREEFHESVERTTDMAAEYRQSHPALTGLLLDTSRLGAIDEADLRWVANVEDARRLSVGLRYQAFVTPIDLFGELSVGDYLNISQKGKLHNMIFRTHLQALAWLSTVANQP